MIGRRPSPEQVLRRLEQTAEPLAGAQPNQTYGYGLVNSGAATAPVTAPVISPATASR